MFFSFGAIGALWVAAFTIVGQDDFSLHSSSSSSFRWKWKNYASCRPLWGICAAHMSSNCCLWFLSLWVSVFFLFSLFIVSQAYSFSSRAASDNFARTVRHRGTIPRYECNAHTRWCDCRTSCWQSHFEASSRRALRQTQIEKNHELRSALGSVRLILARRSGFIFLGNGDMFIISLQLQNFCLRGMGSEPR